ncbi:MAG: type I-C CRISPR-associated protein Cas7/Csd2 [Peptostreptococcaceae bacterium]|nr:type I-C CRISPR-associated protein Cas7/Csd2 [Peptostreptococcaceae bacterium]
MENKIIDRRYEFILYYDVQNGNPNGDPDAGNMPRIDPETSKGIVTDVCIKRKVRNYVELAKKNETGFRIYVTEGAVLNEKNKEAYIVNKLKPVSKKLPKEIENSMKVTQFMTDNFYDIRTFGAVMTTEINCGQVRGPVQFGFSRSIDPIVQQDITITRMAVTNEKDRDKERTMGRKHIVPYALYRMEGYVSAAFAQKTGFGEADLELLWESLENMFEHDHSAARGNMATRKLIVFKHESELGNAHAHKLFELVKAENRKDGMPARAFEDYEIAIDKTGVPAGVELIERM